jgi:hypothetical protein
MSPMKRLTAQNYALTNNRHHVSAVLIIVTLCLLGSYLAVQGFGAISFFFAALVLSVAYIVLISKMPDISFPIMLLSCTDLLGFYAQEKWPIIRFGFGSVSILDILILYPFFWVQFQIYSGKREGVHTVFDRPLKYLFIILAVAILNSIFLKNVPYREVIRTARPYLYYLFFFILVGSIQNRTMFLRLLKMTGLIVVLGCAVQIGQYVLGPSQNDLIGVMRGLMERQHFLEIKTLMVINVGGRDVVRFLMRTGNFAVLLFFVTLFFLLRAKGVRTYVLLISLLSLSGTSIFLTYGRTLSLMVLIGICTGMAIEKEQRRAFIRLCLIIASATILTISLLSIFSSGGENILSALWQRFTGIYQDIAQSRGTFGDRMSETKDYLIPFALKNLPLGAGFLIGGAWDVGLVCFLLHFGIMGPVFYIWILRNLIRRFVAVYRMPLSSEARCFIKGLACFGIGQLSVILIQDPFPIPIGILLVVFFLVAVECIARYGGAQDNSGSLPPHMQRLPLPSAG